MQLGICPEGAIDLETTWADWAQTTDPPITTKFLLAGRAELAQRVKAWLDDSSASSLALKAESSDEAVALFAAIILELPEERQTAMLGRIVVVDTPAASNALALSDESLILVMRFRDEQAVGRARRKGHRTVMPLGAADSDGVAETAPRLGRREAEEALRASLVQERDVADLVTLARRSMTSFRRRLGVRPELRQPRWAEAAAGRKLLAALLADVWNDASEPDRAILSRLSRVEYEDFANEVVGWANQTDPPLRRVGDIWQLVSKEDAFIQLGRYLRREDLDRFREAVLEVLGTPDPRLDLPPKDRWLAGVRGNVRPHSAVLCEGLAETLAIMGARGETITVGTSTLRDAAKHIVRELLGRANGDGRIWASIARLLPLLAEAAPDEFLTAVEAGLTGKNLVIMGLFVEEPSPLFAPSEHTGLLWALETVAWSPDYLGNATVVLGQLARRDPGGKVANRPAETLRGIFLPWLPQTSATVEERLRVLDLLRQREPEAAWILMQQLLPEFHSIGHPTARPHWRDWAPDADRGVTRREFFFVTKEILQRMLDDVGTTGARWDHLIQALPSLPPEQYQAVVDRLINLAGVGFPADDQGVIWNALRELLSHHRSFPDADWALPTDRLEPLGAIFNRLTPIDNVARYAWLFSDRTALPEGLEKDWKEREAVVEAARLAAVESLHTNGGLSGVLSLVPHVQRPLWLGTTLGRSELVDPNEDQLLADYLAADDNAKAEVARGFVVERQRRGFAWVEAKVRGPARAWSAKQRGEFLAALPNLNSTWDIVDGTDAESQHEYWRAMHPWGLRPEDSERVVRKLLEHGRPYSAVQILEMDERRKGNIPQDLVATALEAAIHTDPKTDLHLQSFTSDAGRLLDSLEPDDVVDANRIARLEWLYLPLLKFDRKPKFLHRELARNPQFFAEIVAIVFRAEGEEPRDVSKEEEAKAMHGYELLESWRTIPGSTDAGVVNQKELNNWIREARKETQENGRGKVGDQMIGKMLSGSSPGKDGIRPEEAVRDVIENAMSDDLERGFEIGVYNSRGVVTKNPAEGGEQERQLVKQYEKDAAVLRNQWTRTSAMLRRIAETYREQARREDDQSELMGKLDV
jgi:hypothetical protein